MCSTPYGIKGFCTIAACSPSSRVRSAQRLTASKVFALLTHTKDCLPTVCSTPYGIKGFCTPSAFNLTTEQELCSTPYGIKGFCTDFGMRYALDCVSAQRLTASKVFARCPPTLVKCWAWCSTPYGIKGFCTQFATHTYSPCKKCSTPYGIKGFCTPGGTGPSWCGPECSTPYGIKGFCTVKFQVLGSNSPGAQRLTASKVFALW